MRHNPIRVLLVDDDEDEFVITRDLLSEVENERYEIVWIADYEAALNALGQARHDLCLLDYRLGQHDGLELLRETGRRDLKTPIILLTGQGDHAIDVEAIKAGAADYLVKGQLSSAILERAIRYALERARTIETLRASEERYQRLIDISPDGIGLVDAKGCINLANQQIAQILGHRHWQELVGQHAIARYLILPVFDGPRLAALVALVNKADDYHDLDSRQVTLLMDGLWKLRQHRRVEDELRKLSLAVEQMDDHLIVTDRKGIIEYVNPAFERLTGYSQAEVLGKTPRLLRSGRHEPSFYQELWRTLLAGLVYRNVFVNRKKNGELYYQEETISPVVDARGQVAHFVSTGHDITERIRTEEALRQAEAKYRGIFENAIEGIYQTTLEGHWLSVNPALVRMMGYTNTEEYMADFNQPGKSIHVDPRRREEFLSQLQANSILANFESQVRRKDGTLIWISENARLVGGKPGEITFIEGSFENVTDRKEAHAAIEKLAAFPRENPNPVLEFAANGTLNYFNSAAADMAQRLGHQHPAEILPPNTPDIIKSCLTSGKSRLRVETIQSGRTLSWSFFPLQSSQVVHCYAGDITERLNLEAQLRHSQKLESVGQLAAGVAHDFNNILTVIHGQASLLLTDNKRGEQAADALNQIRDSTDRAINLTRQLLVFSRRQIMQPRALNLNEVVSNITKMLARLLTENIALEFLGATQLPPIWADPGMMEQVLVNLAINARDAMPNGGRLLLSTAAVALTDLETRNNPEARPGPFVCLTVADTGCGMDESILSRIFEPFFTTKEVGKGTGLGLATVYGIVKQHEGWIEVKSQLDQGTQFQLFFPPSSIPVEAIEYPFSPPPVRGGQECILVVEDEPKLREMIKEILEINGYKVHGAGSGIEALRLWEEHKNHIDLLLTDLVMPGGLSGRRLAEKLQAENPRLKVIYTTGYSTELSMKDFPLVEGRNFIPKPFHPNVLAQTVRSCLDH